MASFLTEGKYHQHNTTDVKEIVIFFQYLTTDYM